jgi:hypothetical protein
MLGVGNEETFKYEFPLIPLVGTAIVNQDNVCAGPASWLLAENPNNS